MDGTLLIVLALVVLVLKPDLITSLLGRPTTTTTIPTYAPPISLAGGVSAPPPAPSCPPGTNAWGNQCIPLGFTSSSGGPTVGVNLAGGGTPEHPGPGSGGGFVGSIYNTIAGDPNVRQLIGAPPLSAPGSAPAPAPPPGAPVTQTPPNGSRDLPAPPNAHEPNKGTGSGAFGNFAATIARLTGV